MDKKRGIKRCIIIYPIEKYREIALKTTIRAGINRVILLNENGYYLNFFNEAGLITNVQPILTDNMSLIIRSVTDIILEANKDYDEVSVLLLPTDPTVIIGMYVAACMKKVNVLTGISDFDMECLTLEPFPFVNLNENEGCIFIRIMENKKISTKKLFGTIKREGHYDLLCSKYSKPTVKEISAYRYLHRVLNKLEKIGLVSKEKMGRHFIWKPTSFGISILTHNNQHKY